MELYNIELIHLIFEIIIFILLVVIASYASKRIDIGPNHFLNIESYFPKEEIHSLRQIFYLIMMGLFFINILYTLVFIGSDTIYLAIFDIVLSLYVACTLDKSIMKNNILTLLLVPFGSLTYIVYGNSLVGLIDLIHIPVFVYFIHVYYHKFKEYTLSNGLGIAVLLLFIIVFLSFLATQVTEHVNPLDSLVMVSNAFTSNGYAVLGSSIPGKINSIILVWGGYLLSGVGTATLTAGILTAHFNKKMENVNEKLEKIEKLIEEKE